jgi:hypothetical protein
VEQQPGTSETPPAAETAGTESKTDTAAAAEGQTAAPPETQTENTETPQPTPANTPEN